jgi:hypothetical protein
MVAGCDPTEPEWTKYSDSEGRFEVLLPGTPTRQPVSMSQALTTSPAFEVKLPVDDYTVEGYYSVAYLDLTTEAEATLQGHLDEYVTDLLKKEPPGSFTYKRPSTFAGVPSIEFQWKDDHDQSGVTGRSFISNHRFYTIVAALPPTQHANGDADKFLQSFRLLR